MPEQIKKSSQLPVVSDDRSLARYIQQASWFPILSADEEHAHAVNFAKNRDKASAEKLVSAHLRLVISIAYELSNYGIAPAELIQSGNVGLMRALAGFDPERGFRFSTYATFWIRAEMYDMILSNWSMVKLGTGAGQKKVFFNLARTKRALGIMDSNLSDDQIKLIADKLDVGEKDVMDVSIRMGARDMSLNANKYDEGGAELVDFVADDGLPIEVELEEMELRAKNREMLSKHLMELPERDRDIITKRRLTDPPKTLEELSAEYGISRERVRQIEERAFEKLRNAIVDKKAVV